jgi:anti-sigma regulatory factor (Ser/Thr protein kinase)
VTAPESQTLLLPPEPSSPQRARDFVAAAVEAWATPELREQARLLTSELVTNAVMHARTDVTVTVILDDARQAVRVTVADGSEVPPRRRPYGALATTGRGIAMVVKAAKNFGVDVRPGGKSVWFELPIPAAHPGPAQAVTP